MININKLFRRLNIRNKLVIAFVLIGVIPLVVVGSYGAFFSFSLLSEYLADHIKFSVAMKAEEIQGFLRSVREDVLFLSRLPTLHQIIDLPDGADVAKHRSLVEELGAEFLAFSRAHKAYYQVRYVDEHGKETVRADFDGKKSYFIPPSRLQDKSHRYYFRKAMQIPPGDVYVSPMEPNIERGVVEVPPKPVVRYASPLINSRGERKGIVIINIYASHILGQVSTLHRGEKGVVFLANKKGFYLSHSEKIRSGQDYFSLTPAENLKSDFPGLADQILSQKPGAVVEQGFGGMIVAFAPIFPYVGNQKEFWVIAQAYNKAEVLSSIRSLRFLVLVLGGLVLVVAVAVGVAAARHFTKPILELSQGAEAVAAGDFDRPIRVETNDELEDLSHQFARMATHLKEHERQLREARERAERKAQESEALNRIGMEVLALLSLPQILQLAVDKARELLKGDLAILCLSPPGEGPRLGAVSGTTEALRMGLGHPIPALTCEKAVCHDAPCPAVLGAPFPSHVAVPMRSGDREVGYLCVASREPRSVSPDELEFLSGLATQATIAIENARLHGHARSLASLEERERISKDLHDGIIQSIYATGLGLEDGIHLVDEDPAKAQQRVERAIEDLNDVIRDVRNYIFNLQPEVLHGKDIGQALADLVKGFKINSLIDADLVVGEGIDGVFSQEGITHLFHIAREALANVAKHAQASRVRLELFRAADGLILCIEDNGVGLDADRTKTGGQGLRNIADRAMLLGGDFTIGSDAGRGTRLVVTIPVGDTEGDER